MMYGKGTLALALTLSAGAVVAQQQGGRDSFLGQQAYEQMQRVTGQIDVLQENHDDLVERVNKVEKLKEEIADLRAENQMLKSAIASMKAELQSMRGEIVNDIVGRIKKMPAMNAAPASASRSAAAERPRPTGPQSEYVVASGDSLSLIARAFGTTVKELKEMNGLKSDALKVGQKLVVPQVKE